MLSPHFGVYVNKPVDRDSTSILTTTIPLPSGGDSQVVYSVNYCLADVSWVWFNGRTSASQVVVVGKES